MICTPDCIGRLETRWTLAGDEQHAIEWLDALQIEDIAITVRQQHCPGKAVGVKTAWIAPGTGLSVYRTDFEEAFKGNWRADSRRPRTPRGAELFIGGAHAFAAARMAH